jgi:hypothetical protein
MPEHDHKALIKRAVDRGILIISDKPSSKESSIIEADREMLEAFVRRVDKRDESECHVFKEGVDPLGNEMFGCKGGCPYPLICTGPYEFYEDGEPGDPYWIRWCQCNNPPH